MEISEAHGREGCEGVVHASHHSVIIALDAIILNASNFFSRAGVSVVVRDKIYLLWWNKLLQVTHYVPEEPQEITCSQDGNDELGDSEGVDDGNLGIYTRVVFKVVNALLRALILLLLDFLPQLRIKYSLDVLFELAGIQKIVSLRNPDDLDGIEKTAELAYRVEYFGKWKDCDGVIHKSSFDVIHGNLVEVSDRLTSSFVMILQEKLQNTVRHKYEFEHAIQNESDGTSVRQPERREKHVQKWGDDARKCVDQVPHLEEGIRSQNDQPVEPWFLCLCVNDFPLAFNFMLDLVFHRMH